MNYYQPQTVNGEYSREFTASSGYRFIKLFAGTVKEHHTVKQVYCATVIHR